MDIQAFAERRARLLRNMGRGIAVIPTAPERVRNRDSHYPYRHDSYFYYLSGFPEPEAAVVLVAGDAPQALLFCREKDPDKEVWDGFRHGPEAARETFGFDAAWPIGCLDEKLAELLAGQPVLHYSMGHDADWDDRLVAALNRVRANVRNGAHAPAEIRDVRVELDEMRLIKDAREIDDMRRAADISAAAHRRAMLTTAPGRFEYEIEAELMHEFRRCGAQAPAYSPIVAGGANACILHYRANNAPLRDGDLLLVDAGAEFQCYASDITRTWPVNGRFSAPQRALYELVLEAQYRAIDEARPGQPFTAMHEVAVRTLTRGLIKLGLLEGSLDANLKSGAYKRYYMHKTGHWLGLDVHDVGDYRVDDEPRILEPGMVVTVEPGLYVAPDETGIDAKWKGIGIRIEDDVVVAAAGPDVLSHGVPKEPDAIEEILANR